jgi:hypothetical protein
MGGVWFASVCSVPKSAAGLAFIPGLWSGRLGIWKLARRHVVPMGLSFIHKGKFRLDQGLLFLRGHTFALAHTTMNRKDFRLW